MRKICGGQFKSDKQILIIVCEIFKTQRKLFVLTNSTLYASIKYQN